MTFEGPPPIPEKKEKEPISDAEAQEFCIQGNREKFQEWVDQEQALIEVYRGNPTYARMFFEQKLARIQFAAGEVAEAVERLYGLAEQANDESRGLMEANPVHPMNDTERQRRFHEMVDFHNTAVDQAKEWEMEG